MKKTSKISSVVLAVMLVFAMAIPAMAAGETATGSITVTNPSEGQSYSIYKMFSFVSSGDDSGLYSVTTPWADFVNGDGASYVKVKNGTIEWIGANTDEAKAAFAKAALKYAEDKSIAATETATAGASQLVFDELELGYYLVDSSLGALCALTTTNATAEVTEKNEGPALVKKIVEGEALVDANNVKIGDTVTYQATITVGKGAENYVMHDKMSDTLEYKGVQSVQVNDVDVAAENYTVTTTVTDGDTFEVVFDNAYVATLAEGAKIVVTYTAVLKDNAVVGSTGNPNQAWLTYGDEIAVNKTPVDTVITYTTKLTVNKVDGDNKALTGAGFTLYKYDATVEGDDKFVAVGTEQKGGTTFTWNGLEEGEYKLVETTVPSGYNKADDVIFTITCEEPTEVSATTDTATWESNKEAVTVSGGVFSSTVKNETGNLLPSTGGIGTTIFYVVGAILVIGAVVLLITKKRMSAEA